MADGDEADDEAAETELGWSSELEAREEGFATAQEHEEKRRAEAGHDPETDVREQLPVGHDAKFRQLVDRLRAEELAGHNGGDDGGDDERPDAFHGDGAEDDFRNEKRASERRVVGAGDAGRRAAGDEEAQARGRTFGEAAEERAEHGRELHHGALAADGAAGGDGYERGEALYDRGADADDAIAEDDGFHEVGGFSGILPALAEEKNAAGEDAAERGHEEASPPREGSRGFVERAAFAEEEHLHGVERFAERDGGASAGEADGNGQG